MNEIEPHRRKVKYYLKKEENKLFQNVSIFPSKSFIDDAFCRLSISKKLRIPSSVHSLTVNSIPPPIPLSFFFGRTKEKIYSDKDKEKGIHF